MLQADFGTSAWESALSVVSVLSALALAPVEFRRHHAEEGSRVERRRLGGGGRCAGIG
jgi:hypothetical protein